MSYTMNQIEKEINSDRIRQKKDLYQALSNIILTSEKLNKELEKTEMQIIMDGINKERKRYNSTKEKQAYNNTISSLASQLKMDLMSLESYELYGQIDNILDCLEMVSSLENGISSVQKALKSDVNAFRKNDVKQAESKINELSKLIEKSSDKYEYTNTHYNQYDKPVYNATLPDNIEFIERRYVTLSYISHPFFDSLKYNVDKIKKSEYSYATHEVDRELENNMEFQFGVGSSILQEAKRYKETEVELTIAIKFLEKVIELCKNDVHIGRFDKTKEAASKCIENFKKEIEKNEKLYNEAMQKYAKLVEKLQKKTDINITTKEEKTENKNIIEKGIDALASKINIGGNNSNSKEEPLTPEQLLDEIAMQQVIMEMKEQIGNITASDAKEELLELVNKTSDERALIRCHRQGYAKQYETLDAIPRQDYYSYIGTTKNMYAEIDKKLDEYVAWVNRLENEKRLRELEYKEKIEPVEEPEREIKQPVQEVNRPKSPSFWSTFKDKVINGQLNINLNNIDPDNYNKGMGR